MAQKQSAVAGLTGLKNFSTIVTKILMNEAKHAPMSFVVLMDLVTNEINDLIVKLSDSATFEPLDCNDKNLQRRAYDSTNILIAIGFVRKDQSKGFRWVGPVYDVDKGYPCPYNPKNMSSTLDPIINEIALLKESNEQATQEIARLDSIKSGLVTLESNNKRSLRPSGALPFPFGVFVSDTQNIKVERDSTGKNWRLTLDHSYTKFIDDGTILTKLPEITFNELDALCGMKTPDLRYAGAVDRPVTPKNMHNAAIVHSLDSSTRGAGSSATPIRTKRLPNTEHQEISDFQW